MPGDTAGKVIKCRAAVLWEVNKPYVVEDVEVAPPKAGEIRVKILYCGLCHSDAFAQQGIFGPNIYPVILGHEGSGIVESVGEGVTEFHTGDHVIPLWTLQCRECRSCKHPDTNICEKTWPTWNSGLMRDGTSRFTSKGKQIFQFMNISAFSQFTVVSTIGLAKVDAKASLKSICLIGCGLSTGYGAALNTAKVKKGSTCAVFGLGGIGLAAVMGCQKAGASRIIGVDINSDKFATAKKFGVTECINPKDSEKPIQQVLTEMTDGGLDYTFECIGNPLTMKAAFESTIRGWGVTTIIGVAPATSDISVNPFQFLMGHSIRGTFFGGWKSQDSVPKLVSEYVHGNLKVDEFVSHRLSLDEINEGFHLMHSGQSLRTVMTMFDDN